jgi:hypothetical protein
MQNINDFRVIIENRDNPLKITDYYISKETESVSVFVKNEYTEEQKVQMNKDWKYIIELYDIQRELFYELETDHLDVSTGQYIYLVSALGLLASGIINSIENEQTYVTLDLKDCIIKFNKTA